MIHHHRRIYRRKEHSNEKSRILQPADENGIVGLVSVIVKSLETLAEQPWNDDSVGDTVHKDSRPSLYQFRA